MPARPTTTPESPGPGPASATWSRGPRAAAGSAATDVRPRSARYVGEADGRTWRVSRVAWGERATLPTRDGRPIAFSWGNRRDAAFELAWAILADASGSASVADDWHDEFCDHVIAELPDDGFDLSTYDVLGWLHREPPFDVAWVGAGRERPGDAHVPLAA